MMPANPTLRADFVEFQKIFAYEDMKPDVAFEHFGNYCVLQSICNDPLEIETLDRIHTGGGGDLGLDGIGLIVNSKLVLNDEMVDGLAEGQLDPEFVFVQTKLQQGFDGAEMRTFFAGVRAFSCYDQLPDSLRANETIKNSSFR